MNDKWAFDIRGYYMIISRTQQWGLAEWKKFTDCMEEDGCNTLILWIGGGFPSRKYPETWQYNKDNRNVQENFASELIDYAHEKGIQVLLGFTPHAYDGVNQYGLAHPEFAARKADGEVTPVLGIHSMGRMLCPSQKAVQEFMLEYTREMFFDFHPNADGIFFEYSDYGHCECPECREHYFEREWEYISRISSEIWQAKPDARLVIYPQYYQKGIAKPDERYTLFFTRHSAPLTDDVRAIDCDKIYWQMAFGEPYEDIGIVARIAADESIPGFMVSMEAFSHIGKVDGREFMFEPYDVPWSLPGIFSFDDLVPRFLRATFKIHSREPAISPEDFESAISRELFGVEDREIGREMITLFSLVQDKYRDFAWRNALVHPEDMDIIYNEDSRPGAEAELRQKLAIVHEIARRHTEESDPAREMGRIAAWIVERWRDVHPEVLPQE